MKKSLILLPIAAMVLAGCSLLPSKKGKSSSSSNTQQSGSVTPTPGGGGGGGGGGDDSSGVKPAEGTSHTLPWELKAQDLYDSSKDSYAKAAGVYDFDGTKVTFQDAVMVNDDPDGNNKGTCYVIQLRKTNSTDTSKPKGVLTVSKVKPTTVVITALLGVNQSGEAYPWSSSQIGTVKFNGTTVSVPSESSATDAGYVTGWKLHTVTLNVNASTDGDFVIDNTSNHAVYITSINFKA